MPDGEAPRRAKTRRRGEELESDILRAAWAELMEVGYTRLTMEGVAARAKTSKAVVYRRWANRAELVVAAAAHELPPLRFELPDTGSLRGDILALLAPILGHLERLGTETIHGLLAEHVINLAEMHEHARPGEIGMNEITEQMLVLLERAADRGEVRRDRITPRIANLP